MVRRVCVYCHEDYGEALPREDWAGYPPDTVTHGVCPKTVCQVRFAAAFGIPSQESLA